VNIRNKSIQQLLVLALAYSLFMLTVTTGQFVICITNGHIAIELNGISDCSQSCEKPIEKRDKDSGDTHSCAHCIDTIVTLNEIVKDKDNKTVCTKCLTSNLNIVSNDLFDDNKISSLLTDLQKYKNFIQPLEISLAETTVLLI
jgi:hypothetical protein